MAAILEDVPLGGPLPRAIDFGCPGCSVAAFRIMALLCRESSTCTQTARHGLRSLGLPEHPDVVHLYKLIITIYV